jgi:hypothetical protein
MKTFVEFAIAESQGKLVGYSVTAADAPDDGWRGGGPGAGRTNSVNFTGWMLWTLM